MRRPPNKRFGQGRAAAGFTLIELMISMVISLVVLLAMVKLFNNTTRNNDQLQRAGDVTENGRTAVQLLAEDLSHAGYLGGYVPSFEDLTFTDVPLDVPTAIVDPCKSMDTWTSADFVNGTGITIDVRSALPTGAGCINAAGLSALAGSDVLILRHADTCAIGEAGCAAYSSGTPYLHVSHCLTEGQATAQGSSAANKITLAATASATDGAYVGTLIRLTGGTGKGQVRRISGYVGGSSQEATVDTAWTIAPDATTQYALPVTVSTSAWPLRPRSCVASPSAATVTERRRFVGRMYFVANQTRDGVVIPTLMRSDLGPDGSGGIVFGEPVAVVYGVQAFRVVLGIDNKSKSGTAVDYTTALTWADPLNLVTATNRGDGVPDSFVHCTACTAAQLRDVTAAKIYVLARSRDATLGYSNTKTYCLGELASDGTCGLADTIAAQNDGVQRHVFESSVRLVNVASVRETP
jgi:prepilin-type N-terminal cleavage/methylation domain-containing protein